MGFKIKELRRELGMTQETLAEKSGVSRTIISGLESGRITTTSTGTLLKIANAMEVDVEDIFYTSND